MKNAFCQSNALKRPKGKLYAKPCEGLDVDPECLIEIIAPIYGLDDAPLLRHHTLLEFFEQLGFQRTLLEPCWLVKRDENGKIFAHVLIEVDDLNFGVTDHYLPVLKKTLVDRFAFGKMEFNEADFAGRHLKVEQNSTFWKRSSLTNFQRESSLISQLYRLSAEDFEVYRSLLYRVTWVARQIRPEAAGVVSLLASRLQHATVHDLACLNRMAVHLRNTARQPLVLHQFDSSSMIFVAASDAGGIDGKPILARFKIGGRGLK